MSTRPKADLFTGILPFFHVAEERSFRRAAERLGVTPAAISKAVQKLEAELGAALLVRTSRSVTPTPEGEAFMAHCRQAILAMTEGRERVTESRHQPRGEAHITLSPVLAPRLMRELPRLAERHPAMRFRVTVTDRLVRLAEEGIDVAVRLGTPADSSLVGRLLHRPKWVIVASPRYIARRGMPATAADLEEHACLRFVAPNGRPRNFTLLDKPSGTPKTIAVSGPLLIDEGQRMLDACVAGMGICQVLDFMVDSLLQGGAVVELLGPLACDGPEIHALYPRERSRSPNVKAILGFLTEVMARAGDRRANGR